MATHAHQITSIAALDGVLLGFSSTAEQAFKLSDLRDDFRRLHRGVQRPNHPLYAQKYGFASVYKALDKRAVELGFNKYSFGYRKPLDAQ